MAFKKSSTVKNNNYRISKLERKIAINKPELKYHYTTVSGVVPNLSAIYYNLTNPSQGTSNSERVGDSIRLQWIDVSVDVEAADMDVHILRPLGNAAYPGYSALATSPGMFRPSEYKTYRRKFTTDDGNHMIKWRIPLNGLKVTFQDNTSQTQNSVIAYIRNVGLLSRSTRGHIVCCYTDS